MKDLKISPISPVIAQEKKFPKLSPRMKQLPRDDDFKIILDSYAECTAEDFDNQEEDRDEEPRRDH